MLQTVDADVKKDMTETVDVDSATTIVCGSFCFSAAVVAAVSSEITAVAASL